MDTAVAELASQGILGAICVVLLAACGALYRAYAQVQSARVEDAKRVAETLLQFSDRWSQTINELTDAVRELRVVMQAPRR